MKTRIQGGRRARLILSLLSIVAFVPGACAQWPIGRQVLPPFPHRDNISPWARAEWPTLPFLPYDVPVYYLGTIPGTTNNAFAYDDRELSSAGRSRTQAADDGPPMPGDDNGTNGVTETNAPTWTSYDIGTSLYILTGPTNIVNGPVTDHEAWMVLTNTQQNTYYQLENRPNIKSGDSVAIRPTRSGHRHKQPGLVQQRLHIQSLPKFLPRGGRQYHRFHRPGPGFQSGSGASPRRRSRAGGLNSWFPSARTSAPT